ncbi:MAG: hypothetical protein NPINA01_28740 [Nitrospinaceae bacterium]|nr:MAG: hypothetical protein NPINA01_28740 [Nitrospinaceae bacterium]
MEVGAVTVQEVREAQECLKVGMEHHEKKNFNDAVDAFKTTALIHPFDEKHLPELEKKLKAGGFKKQQESIAYMGCAAVHLKQLVQELSDDQKTEVPVDDQLMAIFKDWD